MWGKALAVVLLAAPGVVAAQEKRCEAEQAALRVVSEKYMAEFAAIQEEGDDLKDESDVKLDGKVTWADTEMIFDTPSVRMKDERLVFGVPQVTMKLNEMVFHTPSTRMVRRKTGQYPEFRCDGFRCRVSWSDIYTDVPEVFMQEQRISMHIPEFRWDNTDVVMGVPEFFMERQRIVMGLPQFAVDSVILNPGPIKERGEALKTKAERLKGRQVEETGRAINDVFACYRTFVIADRAQASAMFDGAIAQMNATIKTMQERGANPSQITTSDGKTSDLVARREELIAKRDAALKKFDEVLEKLVVRERSTMDKV